MLITTEEAKIILLCNNVVDFYFAFNNGVISYETERLGITTDEDGDETFDLDILKKKAIDTVLNELEDRIPRKKVEVLLEEIRKEYFDQINGKDRSLTTKNILTHQYNAMETVLEEILNKE